MTITFDINKKTNIVTHKWTGSITGNYISGRLKELTQLPSWTFGMSHIIDIKKANFEFMSSNELIQVLSHMESNTLRNSKGEIIGKIVLLTDRNKSSLAHELKLFNLFKSKTNRKINLFYDKNTLCKWLNSKY